MSEVWFSFGEAVKLFLGLFGLAEADAASAMEARVRQLAALGVPMMARASENARYRYGLLELTEIGLTLKLVDGRMQPSMAVRYVLERWRMFGPSAMAGIADALPADYARLRPARGGPFIVIGANALSVLGSRAMREKTAEELASVTTHADAAAAAARLADLGAGTFLSSSSFMPTVMRAVIDKAVSTGDVWNSLDRLRQSEGRLPHGHA